MMMGSNHQLGVGSGGHAILNLRAEGHVAGTYPISSAGTQCVTRDHDGAHQQARWFSALRADFSGRGMQARPVWSGVTQTMLELVT